MKKNSFFTKKPKLGFIAFMMVFCCFFSNGAFAQGTFTWIGTTSSSWTTATNWAKSGTATTSTYPGESSSTDLVLVNSTNSPNPVILTTGNTFTVARVTVNNNFGALTGAILTIDSGATLNITSTSVSNLLLNGGNIVNNGAINISTSAPGTTGTPNNFVPYGINCGNPTNLPTVATTYGISGSGTLNITLSGANFASSAAIVVTGNTSVLPTYRIAMNGTITLNQGSTATISAVRPSGGATANKLIISGAGFTVGSVTPEARAQLFALSAGCDLTVDTGTTITFTSAAANANNGIISGFSSSALAFNLTNKGTINIVGSTSRSGLYFSTGATANVVAFNIINEGILNVDLNSSGVAHGAYATGNGGGAAGAGSAININNSGTLTLKNTSTVVGGGFAIYGSSAGEAPPTILTNSSIGIVNLNGTVYNFGSKFTIHNTGAVNSNSELRSFSAINNNVGGSINFAKTAATASTRQVVFNGLQTTDLSGGVGSVYTDGTNNYTVIVQKFGSGTTMVANVLSSATVSTGAGTLNVVSGTGTASMTFSSVSLPSIENALTSTTTNAGTVNTDTASNLNIISGVSAASAGTIAPGGSGKGIADFSNGSTLAINSILKLDISGSAVTGVDYDQITNSATGGGFDISAATLDVTGIYLPGSYTVIDIITTNATGNLTGTFASVVGLGAGWSVVYNPGTAGTVQLVRGTAGTPTITRLSSNGTNTITSACEGSTLVIIGTNLTGVSEITVNGVALTGVTDISSTRAEGILPIGARVGQVAVTAPGGTVTTAGNLTVVENSTVVTAITACDTYTWANNGVTYTTSGTYTGTTTSCVTQSLVLNIVTTPAPIVTSVSQCGGTYVWPSNGVTYSASTNLTIIVGCTSETLNLTITAPSTTGSETRNECGASYTWPTSGATYNASGVYTHVVGCNTATLTLTLGSPSTTGSETVSACGSSYTWALNGQTYNASGNYDHIVGCNTATLSLTLAPNTTTGSETISQCGGTYTWPVNNVTYSASTTQVVTSGCNVATLNLTITPATTTGSESISQCGGTYTWPVNSVTYSASETVVVTSGCNTATLNLTITAPTTNGDVTQVQTGGTYTWSANGTTYATSGVYTHVVGCNTATLTLTINPAATEIPVNFPAFCKGNTVATATGTTSLKFYSTLSGGLQLDGNTALVTGKTLFVTEMINSVESSPRVPRLITVNVIPATPASMTTTDAVLCKYVGTTNTVTYTVATVATATSYLWSIPAGATLIADASATDNVITVNFLNSPLNNITVGGLGTIAARAVNSFDCPSLPRSLVLTAKLPTSPSSLTMTSDDNTPHFNAITTPAVVGVSPAITSVVGLNFLSKITKVGPYMGTPTVFTLTALTGLTPAPTAASYAWTLPGGVTQLSGGTSNVITVDFAGVTPAIGSLPIAVKSVGGCGSAAVARTLTLGRTVPTAPTALTLTDGISATPITKVGPYTGKSTELTLTATPVRVQGATATSYAWILPTGVNIISPAVTTTTTVYQLVNTGTLEVPVMTSVGFTAISTGTSSTITINLAGVSSGITSLPLTVFAVNGAGNSKVRTRTVTAAAPTTPGVITTPLLVVPTFNPACSGTTSITVQVPSVFGVSYAWTVGAGASITNGQGTNLITIDVEAVTTTTLAISVVGSNGTGNSPTRALTIKKVASCREASNAIANEFSVIAYPNPSSSEFTIESSAKGAMSVKVYDMQGRLVEKSNTDKVGSRLATGAYNVIVNQGANVKTLRVIKK